MFTKGQNHRTLFREAECKGILLQFALGYLKPISLRRPQRRGARRNGCFSVNKGKYHVGLDLIFPNKIALLRSLAFIFSASV